MEKQNFDNEKNSFYVILQKFTIPAPKKTRKRTRFLGGLLLKLREMRADLCFLRLTKNAIFTTPKAIYALPFVMGNVIIYKNFGEKEKQIVGIFKKPAFL